MSRDVDSARAANAARLLEDPLLREVFDGMRVAAVEAIEVLDLDTEANRNLAFELCRRLQTIQAVRSDLESALGPDLEKDDGE